MRSARPLPVPTFRSSCSTAARTFQRLRKVMGTSKIIIPAPIFHLKFMGGICRLRCRNFNWAALILAAVMLTAGASAQVSLTPPGTTPDKPTAPDKPAAPEAKPAAAAKPKLIRPAAKKPAPAPAPAPPPAATVTPDDPNADLVYGAYQRGFYKTTFDLATKRVQE